MQDCSYREARFPRELSLLLGTPFNLTNSYEIKPKESSQQKHWTKNLKSSKLRTMRNLIFFTIATLLLSHVTWAGYWAKWGVTCEPEEEIISVCGKATAVKKCRGTCRSLSFITMNFPWYETKCECCKASRWRLEVVHCKHGKEEIVHAHGCSCKNCLGA